MSTVHHHKYFLSQNKQFVTQASNFHDITELLPEVGDDITELLAEAGDEKMILAGGAAVLLAIEMSISFIGKKHRIFIVFIYGKK